MIPLTPAYSGGGGTRHNALIGELIGSHGAPHMLELIATPYVPGQARGVLSRNPNEPGAIVVRDSPTLPPAPWPRTCAGRRGAGRRGAG